MAVSVNTDGRREVLGTTTGHSEAEPTLVSIRHGKASERVLPSAYRASMLTVILAKAVAPQGRSAPVLAGGRGGSRGGFVVDNRKRRIERP